MALATLFPTTSPQAAATVTLTDPYTLAVVATGTTDSTGVAHFSGLTVGDYLMQVSATQHQSVQTAVHIVAGIDLELACAAVAVERDRKRIRA